MGMLVEVGMSVAPVLMLVRVAEAVAAAHQNSNHSSCTRGVLNQGRRGDCLRKHTFQGHSDYCMVWAAAAMAVKGAALLILNSVAASERHTVREVMLRAAAVPSRLRRLGQWRQRERR